MGRLRKARGLVARFGEEVFESLCMLAHSLINPRDVPSADLV